MTQQLFQKKCVSTFLSQIKMQCARAMNQDDLLEVFNAIRKTGYTYTFLPLHQDDRGHREDLHSLKLSRGLFLDLVVSDYYHPFNLTRTLTLRQDLPRMEITYHQNKTEIIYNDLTRPQRTLDDVKIEQGLMTFVAHGSAIKFMQERQTFTQVGEIMKEDRDYSRYAAEFPDAERLYVNLYAFTQDSCLLDYFRENNLVRTSPSTMLSGVMFVDFPEEMI